MERYDVVIVGAGHGGAQAAIALRQQGFAGSIAMIGAEPYLPYERPPLSKEYLAGEKPFERILIRPEGFWKDRNVAMLLGREIVNVDPAARTLTDADGGTYNYGTLIWAAGGAPKRLRCPGHELAGIHVVRTRQDVDTLVAALGQTSNVAVVGGGYIGLEAAAVLTKLGKSVTLIELLPRLLSRVAGAPISDFYLATHRAKGVDIRLGANLAGFVGENGSITGVESDDGTIIKADMAVVGIGIAPSVAPLIEAGGAGGNGIDVDEYCRTTLPGIYAIGDCAAQETRHGGGQRVRIESVQNANDQAVTAARSIMGKPQPHDALPWFWSNQYDARLQTIGLNIGHDETLLRGDPAEGSFTVIYLKEDAVVALDCVNMTRDYVQGRKLVTEGARLDRDRVGDIAHPLKDLVL